MTNAIVIELYQLIVKNNYSWKLLRDILLKISTFKKGMDEKVLCKEVKTIFHTNSTLTAKNKTDDLKTFENTNFTFLDSPIFIANNIGVW